jgi:hypothetical protein
LHQLEFSYFKPLQWILVNECAQWDRTWFESLETRSEKENLTVIAAEIVFGRPEVCRRVADENGLDPKSHRDRFVCKEE